MITELAPAKINLALHLRRRRADGYHDLETLFAFARDGDIVSVGPAEHDRFAVTGPFATALDGGANLVTRARHAFRASFGCPPVAIALEKNLPVASGIGGGSADAAATLRALAHLQGIDPDHRRLVAAAATLGADVPACLAGHTALGLGRGDELQPLEPLGDLPLLLVNPLVPLGTAGMFAAWDGIDRGPIAAAGPVIDRAKRGRNDFTAPAVAAAPVIADVLALLESSPDATLSRLSGSGATCFALFATLQSRDHAADRARARGWWTLASTAA